MLSTIKIKINYQKTVFTNKLEEQHGREEDTR